jgi:hypothetical protein
VFPLVENLLDDLLVEHLGQVLLDERIALL